MGATPGHYAVSFVKSPGACDVLRDYSLSSSEIPGVPGGESWRLSTTSARTINAFQFLRFFDRRSALSSVRSVA